MPNENTENDNSQNVETGAPQDTTQAEEMVPVSKLKEIEETNRQLFERAKKAEGFVKVDGKWVKAPKPEEAVAIANKAEATAGELNETQLDYLDLKGINEQEDIDVIQSVMKRAGLTVRQALSDDYVKTKLASNKQNRDVRSATPSSTRRSGNDSGNDVEYWTARIEAGQAQLNDIPEFELRTKVVEARMRKQNPNLPPWRR